MGPWRYSCKLLPVLLTSSVLIFTLTWNLSHTLPSSPGSERDNSGFVLAVPMISTLKLLFISEKLPEHQAREKVWNSATNLESSGQTDSVRLSRCLIIWGLEVCQGLSSTGRIWKRESEGERLTEDFRDIRGTACAGRVPQPRPSFSTPKLERCPSDNKTACGVEKKSQTSVININQMEAFQGWHFSAGKDVVLACQGSNGGQHDLSLESNLI